MTMSRRDTIIIAALVNAGLLSVLFFTAMRPDATDPQTTYIEQPIAMVNEPTPVILDLQPVLATPAAPTDEVDTALKPYLTHGSVTTGADNTPSFDVAVQNAPAVPVVQPVVAATPVVKETPAPATSTRYVEITVKRGDSLDKIARANGTTINELKRANGLDSDRLDIGQVLKVPPRKAQETQTAAKPATTATTTAKAAAPKPTADQPPAGTVYHTIKPGDNPWKIAKQYSVKFDDLLKLNGLNEEKARNLKVGQKIRVR